MDCTCTNVYRVWRCIELASSRSTRDCLVTLESKQPTHVKTCQYVIGSLRHAVALRMKLSPGSPPNLQVIIPLPFEAQICRRRALPIHQIYNQCSLLVSVRAVDTPIRSKPKVKAIRLCSGFSTETLVFPVLASTLRYTFKVGVGQTSAAERRGACVSLRNADEGAWIVSPSLDAACRLASRVTCLASCTTVNCAEMLVPPEPSKLCQFFRLQSYR